MIEIQQGIGAGNQMLVLTLTPGANISAGIGNYDSVGWTADGAYTWHMLSCAELGTAADEPAFHEFELDISINGKQINNFPVSARALSSDGLGRRFSDLLEGRRFGMLRGDRLDVTFYNVSAANAIRPRLILIGHRGWPPHWQTALVAADGGVKGDVMPRILVVRDPADAVIADANTFEGSHEFINCYSFQRMSFADKVAGTGHRVDFDFTLRYSQGADQTLGAVAAEARRRASARNVCGIEGIDLAEINYGIPQVVQSGDKFDFKFFNDSGANANPRLIYLGHEGMPLGPPMMAFAAAPTSNPDPETPPAANV